QYRFVHYEIAGGVITIRINRPPYNVLDIATMEEMDAALGRAALEPEARLLVVTGAGEKAFSAGVDVMDHTADKVERMIEVFHGMLKRLLALPMPTVAAVNGAALGGGCELAIACDMVLAARGAKIGQPEIKLGVFPPIAAILMPRILPMAKAMELVLGGTPIDADEAHRLGLVNQVLAKETFAADTAKFLEPFLALSKVALLYAKRAIRDAANRPFDEALARVELLYLKELMATEDASEGLNAFIEKRKPVWKNR
ncbi:MAG: enoyl-CoA hydratase/isomerase family protein, partial [Betaproteobacteria bacterium]|nr:enoyl-CoA hydratase/isomerase family protein [Betaproteobacteria bacterium]